MVNTPLKYLPYIIPVKKNNSDDECILLTSRSFLTIYGDIIQEVLRHMGILKKSDQQIKESELDHVISTITEYIEISKHDCYVWDNHNKLIMFSSEKMKPNGLKTYFKQKQQGKIIPKKFMVEKKQPTGFNDKCIIGMLFQSLLILFDKLLRQAGTNGNNISNTLANARLFNIVAATNQVNTFIHAFFTRSSYKKGAMITSNTKRSTKNDINKIIKELGITHKDTTKNNMPLTKERVKKAYKIKFKKNCPYKDKTLENRIIDAQKS